MRHSPPKCETLCNSIEPARSGPAQLVTDRLEGAKQAHDNVVMSCQGKELIAGRVRAFLAVCAPGVGPDSD